LHQKGDIQPALHVVDFAIGGSDDSLKRNETLLLKAALLDTMADNIQNFIAGNIMRTGAVALRSGVGSD